MQIVTPLVSLAQTLLIRVKRQLFNHHLSQGVLGVDFIKNRLLIEIILISPKIIY